MLWKVWMKDGRHLNTAFHRCLFSFLGNFGGKCKIKVIISSCFFGVFFLFFFQIVDEFLQIILISFILTYMWMVYCNQDNTQCQTLNHKTSQFPALVVQHVILICAHQTDMAADQHLSFISTWLKSQSQMIRPSFSPARLSIKCQSHTSLIKPDCSPQTIWTHPGLREREREVKSNICKVVNRVF